MPMSPKRAKSLVTVGTTLMMLLQDPKVRRALRNGSSTVVTWAKDRRTAQQSAPIEATVSGEVTGESTRALPPGTSLPPLRPGPVRRVRQSFGQANLERRVDALAAIAPELEATAPEFAEELRRTEADLRRAVLVTGRLPASKRWSAQRDISKRLDQIEISLVNAVLSR